MNKKVNVNLRLLAVKILLEVCNGKMSNVVLDEFITNYKLNKQSSGFLSFLVYSVLENINFIDYQIQFFSKNKLNKLDIEVLNILRIGVASIYYMNSVRDGTSVDESVKLCKNFKKVSAKNFVNAVLRKIAVSDKKYSNTSNKIDDASINYSVSKDICNILYDSYGDCFLDIIKEMSLKKQISIRVNTLKISESELLKKLQESGYTVTNNKYLKNNLFILNVGDIKRMKSFKEGDFYVQDTVSQICMELLKPKEKDVIIDICSAPGGKSFMLAMLTNDNCSIYSFDKSSDKVEKIKNGINRLNIKSVTADINDATKNNGLTNADIVLCDVPCSGIGVISKKPEIRYRTLSDIKSLYDIQLDILKTSSLYVKNGGKLVYSTCTLNKKENEDIVYKFLKENNDFTLEKIKLNYNDVNIESETLTMLPHITHTDGFFISILRKG